MAELHFSLGNRVRLHLKKEGNKKERRKRRRKKKNKIVVKKERDKFSCLIEKMFEGILYMMKIHGKTMSKACLEFLLSIGIHRNQKGLKSFFFF